MISRTALTCALFCCIACAETMGAQPGDRRLDMKARVLDIVFPLEVSSKPYFRKIVLRFGDSDTQIIVVTYPGGQSEIVRYRLADVSGEQLSVLVAKMLSENPDVKPQEIAAGLKVNVSSTPVLEQKALDYVLNELKAIKISPALASRVAVDDSSEYEFWYDTWQESVHYTITGPFHDAPQDRLGKWMLSFRTLVPKLLKANLEPKQ